MRRRSRLELVEANAEATGLPDASFDLAISFYGASIWCDPYKWIPEAARLLRPGGELVFLRNSTLAILCATEEGPTSETMQRPQRGLHRLGWEGSVDGGDLPVLGVDTIVVCDDVALGKPRDASEAEAMLEQLGGRTHEVVSGLCLRTKSWEELGRDVTRVTFRPLTPRDLAAYVAG